jgi:type II secretory pathway pseudopilin PulG
MVELITIIIILGILAVVALPRIDSATGFRSMEFRDQVIAALRYAQKTATSHRRLVCVTLTPTRVELAIDTSDPKDTASFNCEGGLTIPGGTTSSVSATQDGFKDSPSPDKLFFQPDGRVTSDAAGVTIADFDNTVDGSAIQVRGATGYVGDGT